MDPLLEEEQRQEGPRGEEEEETSARAKRAERRSLSTKGDGNVTPPERRGEGGEEDGGAATAIIGAPPASYEDGNRIWDEEKEVGVAVPGEKEEEEEWKPMVTEDCKREWEEERSRWEKLDQVKRQQLREKEEWLARMREEERKRGQEEETASWEELVKRFTMITAGEGKERGKSREFQGQSTPRAGRAPGGAAEQLPVGRAGKGPAGGAGSPASHGMPAERLRGRGPAERGNGGEEEGPVQEVTQLGSTSGERGAAGEPHFRMDDYSGHRMAKPIFTPGKYDGTGHLTEYLAHFDLCRRANGWDMEQAGVFLGLSLTGVARRLLEAVEPALKGGYLALRRALEDRFQPKNQGAMYKAILRAKERLPGECLQAHAEDIERYTRLAYPKADLMTIDVMAKDRFIESLRDTQLQYWIFQSKPETIRQAVQVALEAEACMRPQGHTAKARVAGATMAEQLAELASVVKADQEAAAKFRKAWEVAETNRGSGRAGGGGRRVLKCYHCDEEGHFRRECPKLQEELAAKTPGPTGETSTSGN